MIALRLIIASTQNFSCFNTADTSKLSLPSGLDEVICDWLHLKGLDAFHYLIEVDFDLTLLYQKI